MKHPFIILSYRKGETPNVIYHNPIKNKFYNYKIYDGGLESPTVLMLWQSLTVKIYV